MRLQGIAGEEEIASIRGSRGELLVPLKSPHAESGNQEDEGESPLTAGGDIKKPP